MYVNFSSLVLNSNEISNTPNSFYRQVWDCQLLQIYHNTQGSSHIANGISFHGLMYSDYTLHSQFTSVFVSCCCFMHVCHWCPSSHLWLYPWPLWMGPFHSFCTCVWTCIQTGRGYIVRFSVIGIEHCFYVFPCWFCSISVSTSC